MINWKDIRNFRLFESLRLKSTAKLVLEYGSAILLGNWHGVVSVGRQHAAPLTATDTATLTVAQMLSQILVCTPTAAAAYTLPTGALFEVALKAQNGALKVGDTQDLTIINIGGTTDDITVTAPASGITLVGDPVVRPSADSGTEQAGQGTFRFRRTAADTYVGYRVG